MKTNIYIKILTAVLLMAALSSCEVFKRTQEKHVEHVTHSYVDSTYYTKTQLLDTAWIETSLASDSINLELLKQLGRFNIDNDRAHTTIVYDQSTGNLKVDTKCDGEFKAYIKSTYEEFSQQITEDIEAKIDSKIKQKEVVKGGFWKWIKGYIWGFLTAVLLVVIYYVYRKLFKPYISWRKNS